MVKKKLKKTLDKKIKMCYNYLGEKENRPSKKN